METHVVFKAWIGFILGAILGCLLSAAGTPADASHLLLAFGLGFGVCFLVMVIFVKIVVPKIPDKPENDKDKWWQRGEPPPWDTYRDDDGNPTK